MKKLIFIMFIAVVLFVFSGCSRDVQNDANVSDFKAIITWGSNGVERINVSSYTRIDKALTVVVSTDGTIYYVHPMNLLMWERRNDNGNQPATIK